MPVRVTRDLIDRECSDVRLVGQETRKRVLELRCPVTVPREIGSLARIRYRSERHVTDDLHSALVKAAGRVGTPLTLAAGFLKPELAVAEREVAKVEGWIAA